MLRRVQLRSPGIMPKNATYASAKQTQRRNEREERVRTGVHVGYDDWRCHICGKWYSKYRGRSGIHLRHCEAKLAKQITREEMRRSRRIAPLPSPDPFPPYETIPDTTDSEQSTPPTREPSVDGDAELQDVHPDLNSLEHLEKGNPFEPPVLNQALLGDSESSGEFYS